LIYLLTANGLSSSGSSTANNTQNDTKQTIHRTTLQLWKSAGRALSWLGIPWHLPYNWGKSTEKPQLMYWPACRWCVLFVWCFSRN